MTSGFICLDLHSNATTPPHYTMASYRFGDSRQRLESIDAASIQPAISPCLLPIFVTILCIVGFPCLSGTAWSVTRNATRRPTHQVIASVAVGLRLLVV